MVPKLRGRCSRCRHSTLEDAPEPHLKILFRLPFEFLLDMGKGSRPSCIGLYGVGEECRECPWREECAEMTESIESSVTRKGTHIRIVSKYKEKKYKPKRLP
jgi:hypothetical protein